MKLSKLFENAPSIEIRNLISDSRTKAKDALYFCMDGFTFDGHDFIDQAIANGAVGIVHTKELDVYRDGIAYVRVHDVVYVLNMISNMFFKEPSSKLTMFGVTGTNGKTTIASILQDFYNRKSSCGYIGTLGITYKDKVVEPTLTTPDTITLHKTLKDMVDSGCEACATEVSSHGLQLHRVDTIDFDVAIFTNLTHDHLDFHGTFENYFNAKHLLFTELKEEGIAIFNADDPYGTKMMQQVSARKLTYGIDTASDYQAKNVVLKESGSTFDLEYHGELYPFSTNLVAAYNVSNLLAVIAALHEQGFSFSELQSYATDIAPISGRMEQIQEGQDFHVIVDFAHTPDGLEKVFSYARSITPEENNVIGVFGSAGKRDIKKRKVFGEIADRFCDSIILTEDDPRDESPKEIADQIKEGIKITNCIFIENRFDAIRQAIESAKKNDTVVILGKGDETFMYKGEGKVPWDGDDNVVRKCISKYLHTINEE